MTGSNLSGQYAPHPRIRFVELPQVEKQPDGSYRSADPNLTYAQAIKARREAIRHCAETMPANIFIADKEPLGLGGELQDALDYLKQTSTELVLGLRDVLDDPETVRREWHSKGIFDAIDGLYDQIWIYGAKDFYDPLKGMGLPENVRGSCSYTGFLYQPNPDLEASPLHDLPQKYLLVTAGGGGDGDFLMNSVLGAYECDPTIPIPSVLLLGPYSQEVKAQSIRDRAATIDRIEVIGFDTQPETLIRHSEAVVGMCGYNTFCEVIARRKPALFVPRQTPRTEQLIRAERAQELGYADMILANDAANPARMAAAIRSLLNQEASAPGLDTFDTNGLDRICTRVSETLEKQGIRPLAVERAGP
ncbi:MAG: hypothetical protein NXI27_00440 [Alphaproteobacteria bacterium]|nr:hypothetical protein [Alphaproteobacteria bacterium]